MIKKAMQPVISKDDLDEHIEKTRAKFRRTTQAYKNGYLSENERFNLFDTGILEGFFRYLESKNLKSLPYIKANWHRFLEDYNLYKRDMEPNSPIEEPWLRYYDQNDYKVFYEADIADKAAFFMLMDEFNIPVEYFKPLSEHQRNEIQREFTRKLIDQYEKQDF